MGTAARRGAMAGLLALAAASGLAAGLARADVPTPLGVNAYPNAKALPLYAGIARGIFARRGLDIALKYTDNAEDQRKGLAAGDYAIMHLAVDNAVAMRDVAHQDVVIVMGGDSGMNEFFVQPTIGTFADLRGKTLVVDAPDTAYALQAKKILLRNGLKDGVDYRVRSIGRGALRLQTMAQDKDDAAAVLNLPYSIEARERGLKSLGDTVAMLGPYQAGGAFVMRAWARRHAATLEHYLAAYIESLRWVRRKSNRPAAISLLVEKLKLSPDIAAQTYDLLIDPRVGFTPDARLDLAGFKNTLALRAEIEGKPETKPASPARYLDLRYYTAAMKLLNP